MTLLILPVSDQIAAAITATLSFSTACILSPLRIIARNSQNPDDLESE